MPVAANDDLDALLSNLPVELPHVPTPVVSNLDGTPAEDPSTPGPTTGLKRSSVTNRSTKRLRKSQSRDRKDRAARMAYRRSAATSATVPNTTPLAEHPTPSPANTNTHPTPSDSTTKGKGGRSKKSRTRLHASWNESGDRTRLDYVNRAGALRGQPFAWTLNLAPDVEKAANDNAPGALDFLARRVRRYLDREPGLQGTPLPSWIVIETTPTGRLHLHGAVFVDNPELLPAIMRALIRAGGTWSAKAGKSYQTDLEPQRHPDAWSAYPLKRQARTRRHLREAAGLDEDAPVPLATWSRDLIEDAKRLLGEERRAIGRV